MGMKDNIHTEIDASLDTFSVKTCFVPNDVKTYDSGKYTSLSTA